VRKRNVIALMIFSMITTLLGGVITYTDHQTNVVNTESSVVTNVP